MNRELSSQVDALVILLDARPPWIVRIVLRAWKRVLERQIPIEGTQR